MADFAADMVRMKSKSAKENQLIALISSLKTVEAVRQHFLPVFLIQYAGDPNAGWRHKLSSSKEFLAVSLKFFAEQNRAEFVQQLSPQANIKRRYAPITTTILAAIWCDFVRQHQDVLSGRKAECKLLLQIIIQD